MRHFLYKVNTKIEEMTSGMVKRFQFKQGNSDAISLHHLRRAFQTK